MSQSATLKAVSLGYMTYLENVTSWQASLIFGRQEMLYRVLQRKKKMHFIQGRQNCHFHVKWHTRSLTHSNSKVHIHAQYELWMPSCKGKTRSESNWPILLRDTQAIQGVKHGHRWTLHRRWHMWLREYCTNLCWTNFDQCLKIKRSNVQICIISSFVVWYYY